MTTLATTNGHAPALPAAQRERWQPLRGGLLNLYRYDHEEFRYEQGHLLLRGNNGTGKSRVLALQLPFLLDGEVSPHRVEPDGDPAKRLEWNLLLGTYSDRLGYTWLEFGRVDDDGQARYLTIGAGLHAIAGKGLHGRWFFVTDQRVGADLHLQSEQGHALTRARLAEEIGERGEVFTTASAYRRAVDRALFGLGEHRYEALVNLLIQLRQPQLSRQLDERKLSAALSEALPPVSPQMIADVADAFRSLEADREALDAFVAAGAGAGAFLDEYRTYARLAAARRGAGVRRLHAVYETTMRKLRQAEADERAASQALAAVTSRLEELAVDERAAEAAVRTLADSPEMRSAEHLDRVRRDADERAVAADRADRELAEARQARAERDRGATEAMDAADASRTGVAEAAAHATQTAGAAGLAEAHRDATGSLALPDGPGEDAGGRALEAAASAVAQAAATRERAVRHVQTLDAAVATARQALALATQSATDLAGQLDEATEAHTAARQRLGEATTEVVAAYRVWARDLAELAPADADDVAWELDTWCRTAQGPSPLTAAVTDAARTATGRLAGLRADAGGRLATAREQLAELTDERDRLATGAHAPPPAPATRDEGARAARPGAPLWRVCDFRPGVGEADRAGLEAALQAAGLLDAWVTPDGRLLGGDAAGDHDTVLAAGTSPAPATSVAELLVPAVGDTPVDEGAVAAVLSHIGLGGGGAARKQAATDGGPVWVAADGSWQAGPAHGRWGKPAAAHIGEGAREAARRRRLEVLAADIARAEQTVADIDAELAGVGLRETTAREEAAAAPDDGPLRRALADIDAAWHAVDGLRARLGEAEQRVATRRREFDGAAGERDTAAADLGLADRLDDLPALLAAVAEYRQAVAALWPTLRGHLQARRSAAATAAQAADAAEAERRRAASRQDAHERAQAAASERDALEATVGAAVSEVLARLADARARAEAIRAETDDRREERTEATAAAKVAETQIATHGEQLAADEGRRATAIDALAAFAATGLLAVAGDGLADLAEGAGEGWSADRAVRSARRIRDELGEGDDDAAWQRTQRDIHRHIQTLTDTLLPHGYEPATTVEDGVLVVTVPFQGRQCSMEALHRALSEEVTHRRSLLDAREREVLENHLIGEVSTHLHDLLRGGERLVAEMNAELADRPMSTGLVLRFAWRPVDDGPAGLVDARRRLLATDGTWSPDERAALGGFLKDQIDAVRAANDTGTWPEHLAAALDYRAWHTFAVERRQEGQWKRLTRRTHGTGSGGEKAIALTVPQFAAAAAHYRSADAAAPRLILLDEAFVGVDADMRSKCMGLLAAFDLDFVMTSEREWGCYATLPGVAIYQLATRPGIDAVGVTRWVWNGRERVRDDRPAPPAAAVGNGDGNGAARDGAGGPW
ncbi:MAG TPA: TIGR02680 family protein [Egibacteraceae bacterium]|nr:TIGR02680 family protein [Egibacteraceae bacterium]